MTNQKGRSAASKRQQPDSNTAGAMDTDTQSDMDVSQYNAGGKLALASGEDAVAGIKQNSTGPSRHKQTSAAPHHGAVPSTSSSSSATSYEDARLLHKCLRSIVVDARGPLASCAPLRPSLAAAQATLEDLLVRKMAGDQDNASLMVLGRHGMGKSLMVDYAVATVEAKYNSAGERQVGIVRLNGLLHPDEHTVFKEVLRQLCSQFGVPLPKATTHAEHLDLHKALLLDLHKCLKRGAVFVVDNMQEYAKRSKQQVLYNLFDVLQDARVQAAVIVIATSHDVLDSLEKRVRSRLSQRKIIVMPPAVMENAEDPRDSYLGLLQDLLTIPQALVQAAAANMQAAGMCQPGAVAGAGVGSTSAAPQPVQLQGWQGQLPSMEAMALHNRNVAAALADPSVKTALEPFYYAKVAPQRLAVVAEAALIRWFADCRACSAATAGPSDPQPAHSAGAMGSDSLQTAQLTEQAASSNYAHESSAQSAIPVSMLFSNTQTPKAQRLQEATPMDIETQAAGPCGPGSLSHMSKLSAGRSAVPFTAVHIKSALQSNWSALEDACVRSLAGMPVLSLYLLVAAWRLVSKSTEGASMLVNFEMAQDELRSLQAAQGLPDYCRAAALASWQSLAAQGALAWADSHVDTRGRDLAYAGVLKQNSCDASTAAAEIK